MTQPLKIIFAGTPEFARLHLQALLNSQEEVCAVLTQQDRAAGRGRRLAASAVKQVAIEHSLPLFQPKTLKSQMIQNELNALNADVMVVVAYGLLLPQAVLAIPRYGCINVHASLLPRWRGAAPIQRAILEGEKKTGITIMQMDEGMDTGEMILQRECPIKSTDTTKELHDRLVELGPPALLEALNQIREGSLRLEKQNEEHVCYAKKITKEEAEIDWSQSAEQLSREIRGFNPWPISYSRLGDQVLRIWKATPKERHSNEAPGTIIRLEKEGIEVATGKGVLELQTIQFPGGKPLPVSEILKGKREWFQRHDQF